MSKELWAAVALTFFVTMSSVFAVDGDVRFENPSLKSKELLKKSKARSNKKNIPLEDQDIESGCSERFNPFRVKYADTADQDICGS